MDCGKVGGFIRAMRLEKGMTQKQLADKMNISDKAVSKWERGLGCPDVSLLGELSLILGCSLEEMLYGDLAANPLVGGNMKNTKYYVCPVCGNISLCTGEASVSCCGRRLSPLTPRKAESAERLAVEKAEDDWFITSGHSMSKEDFISFVAFAAGDRVQIVKQYPEWDLQVRIQRRGHGMLLWYAPKEGLVYQLI